ncbi:MAG: hypothetical protein JNG89_00980 [Planctomycetaceae bacterium]|nr:hypothetical protein [Planctomycetaceae bacterium]
MEPKGHEPRCFWKETFSLKGSVVPRVFWRVVVFGLLSLPFCIIELVNGWRTGIPVTPFEFVGAILGLLLVLRTNSGYDRWYEARKLWGGIVNQCRNLAIIGMTYGPKSKSWREQFINWTAAFAHVTRHSLRGERNLDDVAELLGEELPRVRRAQHMPMVVSARISQLLNEAVHTGEMDSFAFFQAERERALLIDHLGGCERILKTPLASAYSIEIRRFLFAYLLVLPCALVDQLGLLTPLFVMMVAYPLLSLDQIGVDLQNPFSRMRLSHLPLDEISQAIEQNLAAVAEHELKKSSSLHPATTPAEVSTDETRRPATAADELRERSPAPQPLQQFAMS